MLDAELYQKLLGEELRAVRRARGWTRKQLRARMKIDLSLQTLATYELGTRQCSVVRLAELCCGLGIRPEEVLARVARRLPVGDELVVSLVRIIASPRPELAPLQRWAKATATSATDVVRFEGDMVDRMAELCGVPAAELVRTLRALGS
ncbi:helix-turn-helix domain-containing protein [Amycolatopsis sp. lyj-23]|uniref:helix-turn-helix domain-containing protein n=1 Tax=Amycolatopsis sp. lyj-23 TaxID=2789283 RepID=UPI00397E6A4A